MVDGRLEDVKRAVRDDDVRKIFYPKVTKVACSRFLLQLKKRSAIIRQINQTAMKRRSTYRRQCREKMVGENLSENSVEAVLEPRSERLTIKTKVK